MDFSVPEELQQLRASFAAFVDREVRPLEDELAPQFWSRCPNPEIIERAADKVRRRSAEEGFVAAHMPEDVGGQGLNMLGMSLLVEDAAHSGLRLAMLAISPPNPSGPSRAAPRAA